MSSYADGGEVNAELLDEDEQTFQEIDKLQELGINVTDIKRLKEAGICTVEALFMTTRRRLLEIKGFTEPKCEKLFEAAKKLHNQDFVTGTLMLEKRKQLIRITTGSSALDQLLGGGIESASITEAFGEFRTGKTQLAHTLCVTAQLPRDMNGGNGKVIYIDTEGTFRADRILAIADRFGVDGASVLDNVLVARAFNHEVQMQLLVACTAKMITERFALIVIDSSTALFRVDFAGRGTLAERQQKLGQHLSTLIKLAEEFNVAVYITNQVQSDPSGGMAAFGDMKKPIGGNIMAHASTTRLQLKKGRGDQRVCKVYDSPCLPEAECIYQLGEGGVMDAKD